MGDGEEWGTAGSARFSSTLKANKITQLRLSPFLPFLPEREREKERGNFLHDGKFNVLPSGKLGATVSDLCQHVDQHFEIGGLYTFKQPMNLLMNRVLDHSEQFLA
jgi:hypothetical protein